MTNLNQQKRYASIKTSSSSFFFIQMTPTMYRNEANTSFQTTQQSVQTILAIAEGRKE